MLEFLKRLFNPEPSSVTARERLRLVLLSDHLALAPDVVESLKADLIAVISKYVDVDAAHCDVTFEQQESVVAMLANIPILGMKPAVKAPRPVPPPEPPPMIDPAPVSATVGAALEEAATSAAGATPITAATPAAPAPVTAAAPASAAAPAAPTAPAAAAPASKPRRRRRRRTGVDAAPAHG